MGSNNQDQMDLDNANNTTSLPEAEMASQAGRRRLSTEQSSRPYKLVEELGEKALSASMVGAKVSNGSFSGGYGPGPIKGRPYPDYIAGVVIFTIKAINHGQAMNDLCDAAKIMEEEMPHQTIQFTIEKWNGMPTFNAIIEIWHADNSAVQISPTLKMSPLLVSDPSQRAMETMKMALLAKGYTIANI